MCLRVYTSGPKVYCVLEIRAKLSILRGYLLKTKSFTTYGSSTCNFAFCSRSNSERVWDRLVPSRGFKASSKLSRDFSMDSRESILSVMTSAFEISGALRQSIAT
jgi:hypothetical protein